VSLAATAGFVRPRGTAVGGAATLESLDALASLDASDDASNDDGVIVSCFFGSGFLVCVFVICGAGLVELASLDDELLGVTIVFFFDGGATADFFAVVGFITAAFSTGSFFTAAGFLTAVGFVTAAGFVTAFSIGLVVFDFVGALVGGGESLDALTELETLDEDSTGLTGVLVFLLVTGFAIVKYNNL
jgi:hypothetical protein